MSMLGGDSINLNRVPRTLLLTLAATLSLLTSVPATIINVPADQATIQAGIEAAGTGDTVLVAPGYYVENINFKGKEIVVSSHFMLSGDPAFIFATTIDGSNAAVADSASTVRIFCGSTEAPVFQGFTVIGGGGTVMLDPTEGEYKRNGGGIATRLGAPVVRFNYIHHNGPNAAVSVAGGGLYMQLGNPIVENNVIMYNPGRTGCGISIRAANVTARNNVIAYNSGGATFAGGGIYLYHGSLIGDNNTVAFNRTIQPGGGLRVAAASITLRNSIVWGNTTWSGAPSQTYIDPAYGGSISLQYSDVQGVYPGTGNIDADPGFLDPWLFTSEGSPCIDAGDPDVALNDLPWPSSPTEARWPSHGGLRSDMGAWGGPGCYPFDLAPIQTGAPVGWVPWEVTFEAVSWFEADSWTWDFGDGGDAAGPAVAHTYEEPGLYDVTLTIGHDAGETYVSTLEALVYALADTMWVGDVASVPQAPSVPVEIPVYACNSIPLDYIQIPVAYSGDLQLSYEGFSTDGCRTAEFGIQSEQFHDPVSGTILIELSGDPGLSPGSGPILKLNFYAVSAEDGQAATIALTSDLISADPQFGAGTVAFQPATIDGTVKCVCCLGRVGDANGSGTPDPTIGDISTLIDAKFIAGSCAGKVPCLAEADINQSARNDPTCDDITIGDISMLIDYLFVAGPDEFGPLPDCQ